MMTLEDIHQHSHSNMSSFEEWVLESLTIIGKVHLGRFPKNGPKNLREAGGCEGGRKETSPCACKLGPSGSLVFVDPV